MDMRKLLAIVVFVTMFSNNGDAQEGGRQIRLDANTCKTITPEYSRKKNNPLYAKAIAAQKAGNANSMQKARISEVAFLADALRFAKCKGIK
jgi:hypothetical protein